MIGTFGGFVGPAMMGEMRQLTGSFESGLLAMAGIMLVATLLAASLKLIVTQE
jgi:ACS family tartrate transporter-like MFS transporter